MDEEGYIWGQLTPCIGSALAPGEYPRRYVEHKAVGIAQLQLLRQQLAGEPRLDVFGEGLGDVELGGPLAVVALVRGGDAGFADALGQLLAVHHLHGLDLKEAAARGVGRDDVLGQLGVRAGGGAVIYFAKL